MSFALELALGSAVLTALLAWLDRGARPRGDVTSAHAARMRTSARRSA